MHVVATAGHVDHGKSTIVRALTGMEPDRWAEERRRGMTIDLGFAWATLPSGEQVAFVDVPGHERFVANMLAGVGPVPAVMLVIAADEGWMPQTEEHVQAIAALAAPHVLLVVSKCDLAPAGPVATDAVRRLASRGLTVAAQVAVSVASGDGLDELRSALGTVTALPPPDPDAPVRLWVDRSFTVRGAGTVVTGTLAAGRVAVGDRLTLQPSGRDVRVRGMQSLQRDVPAATGVARVALNLRGVERDEVRRGMALVTPRAWTTATDVDVVLLDDEALPDQLVAHIGSAAVPVRVRRLGPRAARLRLATGLPLHLSDRLLLRDPSSHVIVAADAADLWPAPLRRRGDAARLAAGLRSRPDADDVVARRGVCTAAELTAAGLGAAPTGAVRVGDHWLASDLWQSLRERLAARVATLGPLDAGVPLPTLARELELPAAEIVTALLDEVPGLVCVDGRVAPAERGAAPEPGVRALLARLDAAPFRAADAVELTDLAVTPAGLAHAVRAGLLIRLADGVYLGPDAPDRAAEILRELEPPFTVAAARTALGSSRRVVVPLLEHLDATRRTRRLPDGTRLVVSRAATVDT